MASVTYGKCDLWQVLLMTNVTYDKCIMANVIMAKILMAKIFMAKILWQMKLSPCFSAKKEFIFEKNLNRTFLAWYGT